MMSSIKRFSGRPRKNPNSIGVKKDEYIAHNNMNFIHARYHLQCPSISSASNNLVFFHYLGLSINVLSERVNCNIQHRVESSSVWKYEARDGHALFQLTSKCCFQLLRGPWLILAKTIYFHAFDYFHALLYKMHFY